MAVLMMMAHQNIDNTQDGKNPTFHDFFGMSCASDSPATLLPKQKNRFSDPSASLGGASSSAGGTHAPVSTTSDLGSERHTGNLSEGVPLHGPKSDISGPEISNRFVGKKRSNSDSVFMGSTSDRVPQIGPDSLENSHLMKLIRSGVGGERRLRRSHDDEVFFAMQPPRQSSSSKLMLQPPVGSRPDSITSKWERATLTNSGPTAQYQSRLGQCQFATHMDKDSSNKYRDANTGPSVITQPAADEGSRTGIKGSGILSGINAGGGVLDRNSSKVLLSNKPNSGPQIADPESSNPPSRHGLMSSGRQMTIFYDGQAHVFDDVQRNKADVIMALAGSNGGSWSTSYSSKSNARPPPQGETSLPSGESEGVLPQELCGRLSMPGNSSHGFNKGVQIFTTANDPMSLSSSGGHQGSMIVRETRPITSQLTKLDSEGKREVYRLLIMVASSYDFFTCAYGVELRASPTVCRMLIMVASNYSSRVRPPIISYYLTKPRSHTDLVNY